MRKALALTVLLLGVGGVGGIGGAGASMQAWSAEPEVKAVDYSAPLYEGLPPPRSDVPPALGISPKQNLELMRKAWKTQVALDYNNTSFNDVVKDLAKQSGIPITVVSPQPGDSAAAAATVPAQPSVDYSFSIFIDDHLTEFFLGQDAAVDLSTKALTFQGWLTRLNSPTPLPLAPTLEVLALRNGLNVSYRADSIVLGNDEDLFPELLVTYTFRLTRGGWGSIYTSSVNGEIKIVRLSVEDTVAYDMLRTARFGLKTNTLELYKPVGLAQRMRAFKPGLDVRYDPATKTLVVCGTQAMVRLDRKRSLKELDVPEPDGPEFRAARLKLWSEAAWGKLEDPARAEITRLVLQLDSDHYSDREQAVKELIAKGPVAAFLLLPDPQRKPSPEAALRAKIVLDKIYGDEELKLLKERAEGYLRAAGSGDLATMRTRYWDQERNTRYEKEIAKESAVNAILKAAKLKPHEPYELKIDDPKLERIALSGSVACVTFSTTRMAKDFGVPRTVSHFFMIFDGKVWNAGPGGMDLPLETDPITWTADDGLPAGELDPSRTKIVRGHSEPGKSTQVSTSAYAVDFGL